MNNFSWIKSRRKLIIFAILDCIVILFSLIFIDINSNNNLITLEKHIQYLVLSFIWCSLSYITGRYDIKKNNFFTKKTKKIFREIFLISSLSYITILLLNQFFINFIFNNLFFKLLLISFIFITIQLFLKHKLKRFAKEKIIVWHIGKKENINTINFYINNIKNNINVKIIDFPDQIYSIPDEVIISDFKLTDKYKSALIKLIKQQVPIRNINQWCEVYLNIIPSELLNEIQPFSNIYSSYKSIGRRRLKRISDISFSIIILICSTPLLLIACLIIKLIDGGPIFYSQVRTGLWGEKIKIFKLRTMVNNAEEKGITWSYKNDRRITPIGKILRKTRFDEVPQLLSVIKGEMSLIGPRPERPELDSNLELIIKNYQIRYWIKPGLSGWAQVNYPYGASNKDSKIKLSYDLFYINNISILLDLLILFKTIFLVISAKGSEPNQ